MYARLRMTLMVVRAAVEMVAVVLAGLPVEMTKAIAMASKLGITLMPAR